MDSKGNKIQPKTSNHKTPRNSPVFNGYVLKECKDISDILEEKAKSSKDGTNKTQDSSKGTKKRELDMSEKKMASVLDSRKKGSSGTIQKEKTAASNVDGKQKVDTPQARWTKKEGPKTNPKK